MLIKAKIKYWQPQKWHSLTYFTHLQFYKSHIPKLAENAFIFSCHRPELGRGSQQDRTANTLLQSLTICSKNSGRWQKNANAFSANFGIWLLYFIFSCHCPELGRGSQQDWTANTLLYKSNYCSKTLWILIQTQFFSPIKTPHMYGLKSKGS